MRTRLLKSVWLPMAACFLPQFLFAQGALTPPGAPAPAMKTLAQIEPRTPISSAPFTITNPGSYYLTTNLFGTVANNGITINSGNVVLDLEGFSLSGATGGNYGIYVNSTCTNVTVRNGTLRGWSSGGAASAGQGVLLERLHAYANGGYGLHIGGGGSIVRDCSAVGNVWSGVYSGGGVVSGCAVSVTVTAAFTLTIARSVTVKPKVTRTMVLLPSTAPWTTARHKTTPITAFGLRTARCAAA